MSGDTTAQALATTHPPKGKPTLFTQTTAITGPASPVIALLATIYGPHTIGSFRAYTDIAGALPSRADILISHDDSIDNEAEVRDEHITGLTGPGVGMIIGVTPLSFGSARTSRDPLTYYKTLIHQPNAALINIIIDLSITPRGATR